MNFNYETVGNSNYLVATFEGGQGVINYQLQMLTNNDIRNIIKANKRQKNDDIVISYNITAKSSLEMVLASGKLTKKNVIALISGALKVLEEIEEYQLTSSGLMFNEKYIFLDTVTYEPSFIYLPSKTDDIGIQPIKDLLINLIMSDKIEITSDSFIQILLGILNKPSLSFEDLKAFCQQYSTVGNNVVHNNTSGVTMQQSIPQNPVSSVENNINISNNQNERRYQNGYVGYNANESAMNRNFPNAKKMSDNFGGQSNGYYKNNSKKEKKVNENKDSSSNSKMPLFIVLQVIFAAIIVLLIFTGTLSDDSGSLNIKYLVGVLIAVGGLDFVVYRETFVNNKEDKKVENKKTTQNRNSVPKRPNVPNIPQKPVNNVVKQNVPADLDATCSMFGAPKHNNEPKQNLEDELEATVVLTDNNEVSLEYMENGVVSRIVINKDHFIVGKLQSRCDYAINNNKISKIHAEFIKCGNCYFVKDCNSTNGTYINGSTQRILSNSEYQIFNGDKIRLANVEFVFNC